MEENSERSVAEAGYIPAYRPEFFRLNSDNDLDLFNKLKEEKPDIQVFDHFERQKKELIKSKLTSNEVKQETINESYNSELKGQNTDSMGVWVYYPWKNSLIHMLDETEFALVRTSRNLYKISHKEAEILGSKKVGIIGLSVGHAVATNLALERTVRELRLADFDDLELSNLNRIKTNLFNIGLPKVIIAAREIAEIDPFINVKCYLEGISDGNLNSFFTENGSIDLLIEECDGLDIKIKSRLKARELGIPVLMETSDRGMIDIERFDLEPDRPILHGMIDHLDVDSVGKLKTSEEKVPFLMPMVGIDTMSVRLKASALEVGSSINTWPQLASSVMLGGAILSDTYRRVMLNQFKASGRYLVDPSEILKGSSETDKDSKKRERKGISDEKMIEIATQMGFQSEKRKIIESSDLMNIVKASCSAPSGGNSQPWKWLNLGDALLLFFDSARSESFMDYQHSASYLSLGACLENALLKSKELGYETRLEWLAGDSHLIASLRFIGKFGNSEVKDNLSEMIENRYSDRSVPLSGDIQSEHIDLFKGLEKEFSEINLDFFHDSDSMSQWAEIVGRSDRLRVLHPEAHTDLVVEEMRWNREDLLESEDGIYIEELKLSPGDLAGLKLIKDQGVTNFLHEQNKGEGLKRISGKLIKPSPLMIYASGDLKNRQQWLEAGQLMERLWLLAQSKGYGVQVLNVPFAFLLRWKNGETKELNDDICNEIEAISDIIKSLVPNWEDNCDIFLMRIFKTGESASNSVRRDWDKVLTIA